MFVSFFASFFNKIKGPEPDPVASEEDPLTKSVKVLVEQAYEKEIAETTKNILDDTTKNKNAAKVVSDMVELKSRQKYGVLRCDYDYKPTRGDPGEPSTFTYDGSPEPVIRKVEGWTFEAVQRGLSDRGSYPASEFLLEKADGSKDPYWNKLWEDVKERKDFYQVKEKIIGDEVTSGYFEEEDYKKGVVMRYNPDVIEANMKKTIEELDAENVCAITADVGYSQAFQQSVVKLTTTPVILSSLQQLSILGKMFDLSPASGNKIVVMCANGQSFNKDALIPKDINLNSVHVHGLENNDFGKWVAYGNSFSRLEEDDEDPASVEGALKILSDEFQDVIEEIEQDGGKVVCLVQECAELPAYTNGLRNRFNVPVYDTITAIEFAKMGLGFSGHSAHMM